MSGRDGFGTRHSASASTCARDLAPDDDAAATDFDADLCALATAAMQVQQHVALHPNHQVTIYSTNPAAIQAITNLCPQWANLLPSSSLPY